MARLLDPLAQALLVCVSLGVFRTACADSFKFQTINPGQSFGPNAINASDVVVGGVDINNKWMGAIWAAGQVTYVSGVDVFRGVNDQGIAVGGPSTKIPDFASYNITTGQVTYTPISFKTKGETFADGINDAGEVIGSIGDNSVAFYSIDGATTKVAPPNERFLVPIQINKKGDFIARSATQNYENPLIIHKHKIVQFAYPSASYTTPFFIANDGFVGGGTVVNGISLGFLRSSDGTYSSYSPPASSGSFVTGIGPSGQIYGYYGDANGVAHGFVDIAGSYYEIDAPAPAVATQINGVGSSGTIYGVYYDNQNNQYGFIATCRKQVICTR